MTSGAVCNQSILEQFIDTYAAAETYSIKASVCVRCLVCMFSPSTMNFLRMHHWSYPVSNKTVQRRT